MGITKTGITWTVSRIIYGYNKDGFNKDRLYKKTGKKYNEYGFDVDRLHEKTGKKYNEYGFDIDGNPEDGSVFIRVQH